MSVQSSNTAVGEARGWANATRMPGVALGEEALVGAGIAVTRDVTACQTVVGIAAGVPPPTPLEQPLTNSLTDGWGDFPRPRDEEGA